MFVEERVFPRAPGEQKLDVRMDYVVKDDKAVVYFKDEDGKELAHITVRLNRGSLHADFAGAKEDAERLASILNALGVQRQGEEQLRVVRHVVSKLHRRHTAPSMDGGYQEPSGGAPQTRAYRRGKET